MLPSDRKYTNNCICLSNGFRTHSHTRTFWWIRTETSSGALFMCSCLFHRVSGPKTNNVEKSHTHAECDDATETNAHCCVSVVSFVFFYLFVLGHCTYVHCICFYFFIFFSLCVRSAIGMKRSLFQMKLAYKLYIQTNTLAQQINFFMVCSLGWRRRQKQQC